MRIEAAVSEADIGGVEEDKRCNSRSTFRTGVRRKVTQVRFAASTNQNVVTYTSIVDVENKDLKLYPDDGQCRVHHRCEERARFSGCRPPVHPAGVTSETNAPSAKAAPERLIEAVLRRSASYALMSERRRPTDAE
jgi:hypothetical protein